MTADEQDRVGGLIAVVVIMLSIFFGAPFYAPYFGYYFDWARDHAPRVEYCDHHCQLRQEMHERHRARRHEAHIIYESQGAP